MAVQDTEVTNWVVRYQTPTTRHNPSDGTSERVWVNCDDGNMGEELARARYEKLLLRTNIRYPQLVKRVETILAENPKQNLT